MEITHLDKTDLYKRFAKACSDFGGTGGGNCFADNLGLGCPFFFDEDEKLTCEDISPKHWEEVFEKREAPEPRYRFGDRVTVTLDGGEKRRALCGETEAFLPADGGADGMNCFIEGFSLLTFLSWGSIREGWNE